MKICVLSRTGRGGQYDPHVFHLGSRRHPVVAVLAQWTRGSTAFSRSGWKTDAVLSCAMTPAPGRGSWPRPTAADRARGPGAPP